MTNRQRTITYFRERLQRELDSTAENVAKAIAKMSTGKPGDFSYQVRWGTAVADDLRAVYLVEMIDTLGKCERGELGPDDSRVTFEGLATFYVDMMTGRAMTVEHSSNPHACAVSLEEQAVAKRLREEWVWFRASLAEAKREDAILKIEEESMIVRSSIDDQKKLLPLDDARAGNARKILAEMRRRLRERKLSETSHGHAKFWIAAEGAVVLGMVGQDPHPNLRARLVEEAA